MLDFNDTNQFRELKDFPGYGVGADGTVWSRWGHGPQGLLDTWRQLRPAIGTNKYLYVSLSANRKQFSRPIHRLVLCAFAGPPFDGARCRHLDGNMYNNHADNLAWGTAKENMDDMKAHGTVRWGERSPTAILSDDNVRECRREYEAGRCTQEELARRFGCSRTLIYRVLKRKAWKHIE